LFKQYTWLALVIGLSHSASSWAQADYSPQTLVETLNSLPQACRSVTTDHWSESSIQQLQRFYQSLEYTPLWQDAAPRDQLVSLISDTRYDGLEPSCISCAMHTIGAAARYSSMRVRNYS